MTIRNVYLEKIKEKRDAKISKQNMKKKILSLALLAALFATGCGNTSESNTANPDTTAKPTETATQPAETTTEEPLPETMTITGAKLVSVSETVTLTANVANATWTSSDETVATVAGGVVTGVKAGTATITASYLTLSATFEVTVLDNIGSTLNQENKTEVHVKGQVAAADNYGFILTDIHNYVYVYASGHGLEAGEYIDFQGTVAFDSTKNYVYELKPNSTSVKGDDNNYTTTITGITKLTEGDYETIVPTYEATAYDEASLNAMTYAQGAVYATMIGEVKSGYVYLGEDSKAKLSSTLADGYYNLTGYVYKNNGAWYVYNLSSSEATRPAATGLTITNGDTADIYLGNPLQLETSIAPFGALDEITWISSDTTKATVSETGLVTLTEAAAVNDTVTITAALQNNTAITDSIVLTVKNAEGLTFTETFAVSDFTTVSPAAAISQDIKEFNFSIENGLINTSEIRVYKGKYLKIDAGSKTMYSIKIVCNSNGPATGFGEAGGFATSGNNGEWTSEAGASSLTLIASNKQVKITGFEITYKL